MSVQFSSKTVHLGLSTPTIIGRKNRRFGKFSRVSKEPEGDIGEVHTKGLGDIEEFFTKARPQGSKGPPKTPDEIADQKARNAESKKRYNEGLKEEGKKRKKGEAAAEGPTRKLTPEENELSKKIRARVRKLKHKFKKTKRNFEPYVTEPTPVEHLEGASPGNPPIPHPYPATDVVDPDVHHRPRFVIYDSKFAQPAREEEIVQSKVPGKSELLPSQGGTPSGYGPVNIGEPITKVDEETGEEKPVFARKGKKTNRFLYLVGHEDTPFHLPLQLKVEYIPSRLKRDKDGEVVEENGKPVIERPEQYKISQVPQKRKQPGRQKEEPVLEGDFGRAGVYPDPDSAAEAIKEFVEGGKEKALGLLNRLAKDEPSDEFAPNEREVDDRLKKEIKNRESEKVRAMQDELAALERRQLQPESRLSQEDYDRQKNVIKNRTAYQSITDDDVDALESSIRNQLRQRNIDQALKTVWKPEETPVTRGAVEAESLQAGREAETIRRAVSADIGKLRKKKAELEADIARRKARQEAELEAHLAAQGAQGTTLEGFNPKELLETEEVGKEAAPKLMQAGAAGFEGGNRPKEVGPGERGGEETQLGYEEGLLDDLDRQIAEHQRQLGEESDESKRVAREAYQAQKKAQQETGTGPLSLVQIGKLMGGDSDDAVRLINQSRRNLDKAKASGTPPDPKDILPGTSKRTKDVVINWLKLNGAYRAEPKSIMTHAEAAKFLGITQAELDVLMKRPDFPATVQTGNQSGGKVSGAELQEAKDKINAAIEAGGEGKEQGDDWRASAEELREARRLERARNKFNREELEKFKAEKGVKPKEKVPASKPPLRGGLETGVSRQEQLLQQELEARMQRIEEARQARRAEVQQQDEERELKRAAGRTVPLDVQAGIESAKLQEAGVGPKGTGAKPHAKPRPRPSGEEPKGVRRNDLGKRVLNPPPQEPAPPPPAVPPLPARRRKQEAAAVPPLTETQRREQERMHNLTFRGQPIPDYELEPNVESIEEEYVTKREKADKATQALLNQLETLKNSGRLSPAERALLDAATEVHREYSHRKDPKQVAYERRLRELQGQPQYPPEGGGGGIEEDRRRREEHRRRVESGQYKHLTGLRAKYKALTPPTPPDPDLKKK